MDAANRANAVAPQVHAAIGSPPVSSAERQTEDKSPIHFAPVVEQSDFRSKSNRVVDRVTSTFNCESLW